MKIEFRTVGSGKFQTLELPDMAFDIKINGIIINERENGVYVNTENSIIVKPMSANKLIIEDNSK